MADDIDAIVKAVWQRVNEIATTTEDTRLIRSLIGEACIKPGVHVGREPAEFTPTMVGEWVLGQLADMIDTDSPLLNSGRNVSLHQFNLVHGGGEPT